MRTLALETSLQCGSIALLDGLRLVLQSELPAGRRTAQTLVPAIGEALERAGWSSPEVGLVAVTHGPGSFTGLRIGVTTAKVFAYAAGCDILGLDTLEVLACQCPPELPEWAETAELWAVMDAQRGDLFAARFTADGSGFWSLADPTRVVAREPWLQQLPAHAAVTGPGLRGMEDRFFPPAGAPPRTTGKLGTLRMAPPELWAPRAEMVARLAVRRYEMGQRGDVWRLLPQYFRPSAAEEKRG